MIEGKDLFDFSNSLAGERLQCAKTPWEALAQISAWICEIGAALDPVEYEERSPQVWVHRSAHIAPTAYLGAGAVTSNVRSDKRPVVVHGLAGDVETGRKKVGALVGDGVETLTAEEYERQRAARSAAAIVSEEYRGA